MIFPPALIPFKGYLMGAVAVLLGLSIAGNFIQYHQLDLAKTKLAVAEESARTNLKAANTCSEGVDALKKTADDNAKKAAVAIAAAKAAQRTAAGRAQAILSTPATVPGDVCQSATDRATRWLNESN